MQKELTIRAASKEELQQQTESYRKQGYAVYGKPECSDAGEWQATLRKLRPSPEEQLQSWRRAIMGFDKPNFN